MVRHDPHVSGEELGPYVARVMENRPYQDVIGFFGIEDYMRLKTKSPMSGSEFVNLLTNSRKVRKKAEGPLESSVVRCGLIAAERGSRIIVNFEKLVACAD